MVEIGLNDSWYSESDSWSIYWRCHWMYQKYFGGYFLRGGFVSDMSDILKINEENPRLLSEIGNSLNIEMPTRRGKVFRKDIKNVNGWRL